MSIFKVIFLLIVLFKTGLTKPQYDVAPPSPPAHKPPPPPAPSVKAYDDSTPVVNKDDDSKVKEAVAQFEPGSHRITPGPVPPPKSTTAPKAITAPSTKKSVAKSTSAPVEQKKVLPLKKQDKSPESEEKPTKYKYNGNLARK